MVGERAASPGRTRRVFVGGVAAAGAAHVLAGPLRSAVAAKPALRPCTPTAPGSRTGPIAVTPDGRTVWTTDVRSTTISAWGGRDLLLVRSIDVGGAPVGIAISPDGAVALVTTAFFDRPGLAIVDLRSGEVDRVDVGPEPGAVAFAADRRSAYVAGGGADGTLTRVEPRSRRVHAPVALGRHPRDVAVHPDGRHALVTLNGESAIAVVALAERRIVRRIATRPFPYHLAVAPDGTRALVTYNGFGERHVTPIDLLGARAGRPISVGLDPAGVAFSRSGAVALVAAAGSGRISLVDGRSNRRRRLLTVGGAPRAVAVAGTRGFVADAVSGRLRVIKLGLLA